jgi:hypothetical protein
MEHDRQMADEARSKMLEACGMWLDQWEHIAGSPITGFLVAVEYVHPNDTRQVLWAGGDGSDTADNDGGLAAHAMYGIIRYVEADLDAWMTNTRGDLRAQGD